MGKTTFTLKRITSYPITTKLFAAPVSGVARIVGTSSNLGAMAGKASLGGGRAVSGFGQSVGTHNISGTNWASHYKGMDWNNAIKDFNKTYKVPRTTTTSTALVPYKPTTPTASTSTALTVSNPKLPATGSTSTALVPSSGSVLATTPKTGGSTSTALTSTASPISGTTVSGSGNSKSGITIMSDLSSAKEVPLVKNTGPITNTTSSTSTSTVTKKSYQSPTTNELVPKGAEATTTTKKSYQSPTTNELVPKGAEATPAPAKDGGNATKSSNKKGWSKGKKWAVGITGTALVGTGYAAKKVDDAANGIG